MANKNKDKSRIQKIKAGIQDVVSSPKENVGCIISILLVVSYIVGKALPSFGVIGFDIPTEYMTFIFGWAFKK